MYDELDTKVWESELDIYGKVKQQKGEINACPFRYQGQYEDIETGLYYNRFRYYSPEEGLYLSQDPIRLAGNNPTLYAYTEDVNCFVDPFGLNSGCGQNAANANTRFVSTTEGVVHDLKPTLDRIASGGRFPHRNDGSIFRNTEGLLPRQNTGYYKEFVHPTHGVNGPGPMRIVTGQGGEMWFTPDHYRTFIPIR